MRGRSRQIMIDRLVKEGRIPAPVSPSVKKAGGKERLYALGRLKVGEMNMTERKYEDEILRPGLLTGAILWYRYEGIKLRLADNTFLTVDFAVLPADGVLTMCDVKGARAIMQEDARVKMRVAANSYPFRFELAFPKKGGGWTVEVVT